MAQTVKPQRVRGHNVQKRQGLLIWDDQVAEETQFYALTGIPKEAIQGFQEQAHNHFVDSSGRRSVSVMTLDQLRQAGSNSKLLSVDAVTTAGPFDYVLISGVRVK